MEGIPLLSLGEIDLLTKVTPYGLVIFTFRDTLDSTSVKPTINPLTTHT